MPQAWFDERFDACARSVFGYWPVRLLIGLALAPLLGVAVSWTAAGLWFAAAVIVEIVQLWASAPFRKTPPEGARARWVCMASSAIAIPTWSAAGVLFWSSSEPASHIAGASFFAGHFLYVQAHHGRSPAALAPALPALIAPAVVPLLIPHYEGLQQVLVVLTIWAVVAHALISLYYSLAAAAELHRAQAEMLAASRAKSEFLAKMSHEIRTPLNGVLGMAQSLQGEGGLAAEQKSKIATIQASGAALLAVLNDVLDLSKIEAGKLELEICDFDLEALGREVVATFSELAAAKSVSLQLEIAEAARGVYRGDPMRLRQVVSNLVSNALKFTPEGEVRLSFGRAGEGLEIAVSDSGIGMAPEVLDRLFGRFEQADNSITRRYGGTGLGLSICRELVGLMGGGIRVESAPGVGSRFIVSLPLQPLSGEAVAAPADASETRAPWRGEALRVLAAEDNPTNQAVLRALLSPVGVEPTLAADGLEALEAWEQGDWDLVLMDVQMPRMDGVTAARAIRARERASGRRRTPIIALTANAMTHQVAEYLAAGMDAHVAKPIETAELYRVIEHVLSAEAPAASATDAA